MPQNETLNLRSVDLAHAKRRFAYGRVHHLLRREAARVNYRMVYRLQREAAMRRACGSTAERMRSMVLDCGNRRNPRPYGLSGWFVTRGRMHLTCTRVYRLGA